MAYGVCQGIQGSKPRADELDLAFFPLEEIK